MHVGEGDLLSQWRAYAADGAELSIGFDDGYLNDLAKTRAESGAEALSLQRVVYSKQDQDEAVESTIEAVVEAIKGGAFDNGSLLLPLVRERKAEV
ncbi:DUF2971 domain-containing protein [Bradyrhizobium pachyrhizi]|uniref:DUF2971 domain-containing protein n=1 Tax=Bradyrhizobium pachyrhizi TaxID=280333 RepID=UPI0012E3E873